MNYDELLDELFWEEDADDAWAEGRSAGYSDAINDAIATLQNL